MKPAPRRRPPDLTAKQRTAVTLTTVRERVKHRRWPVEIIEKFIAAEVITTAQQPLPALGLLNGVARRFQSLRSDGISYAGIVGTFRR